MSKKSKLKKNNKRASRGALRAVERQNKAIALEQKRYAHYAEKGRAEATIERYARMQRDCPLKVSYPASGLEAVSVTTAEARNFYASAEWTDARKVVLQRWGKRCACCGETEGVFHVDHIKPLRKYWDLRLRIENLQVLCEVCNSVKGNWCETDFRGSMPNVDNLGALAVRKAVFDDERLTAECSAEIELFHKNKAKRKE